MNDSTVVVYTSRNCSKCDLILEKLSEWNVQYEERNISDNREYFRELQSQKVYGTPATFINGEKVLGFQERKLKRVLGLPYENRFLNNDAMNFS
ncbi:glutaredoxin family protein [Halobacillus fulvus]|nr:glutaredoxin family protein [Halobacillus fulvus]